MELDPEEKRVLACLAEKQLTTPAQYPLTLNALTLACNQTTSRDPVVSYDERTVEETVNRAKTNGLARFFHPAHGRSALRYGHTLDEVLGLDTRQLALLTVLMLRGPQTLAELRTRTQRMAEFSSTGEVQSDLEGLARREPPLVMRLDRQPGQKEERYIELLGAPATAGPATEPASSSWATPAPSALLSADGPAAAGPSHDSAPPDRRANDDQLPGAPLAAELADLRLEVVALRRDVDDLRSQLGL